MALIAQLVRRSPLGLAVPAVVVGTIVVVLANLLGAWWVTTLAGAAIAAVTPGGRITYIAAGLSGVLGWGLPLAWQALSVPIGRAAAVVSSIIFGAENGALLIVATLIIGLLFCLSGAWAALALRQLLAASGRAGILAPVRRTTTLAPIRETTDAVSRADETSTQTLPAGSPNYRTANRPRRNAARVRTKRKR